MISFYESVRFFVNDTRGQTAFLSVLFLSSLGMILYNNGDVIRTINDDDTFKDVDIPAWFALEFAGAFLAVLFWVCALAAGGVRSDAFLY